MRNPEALEALAGFLMSQSHNRSEHPMRQYQISSPLAMGACLISGALSILLLIEPALKEGFTLHHGIGAAVSIGLVSLTIATGILAHSKGFWTAAGAALAALSLAGSAIIVWEQSGRRAQTQITTQTAAVDTVAERARLARMRAEADEILTRHRAEQARECATGKGKRCDGVSYTVRTWEAAREGYDAKLRGLPVVTPDAKSERVATAAGLLGHDAKAAKVWVSLLDPLAMPVWLEWVSILCGVIAIGLRPLPATPVVAEIPATPSVPSVPNQMGTLPETSNSKAEMLGTLPVLAETDEARVLAALSKRGGQVYSQRHLSIVLGVSPAETCRMLKKCSPDRIERRWDAGSKSNVVRIVSRET